MSKFIKLPDKFKDWSITSLISESDGSSLYSVSRKTQDGEQTAVLHHIYASDDDYGEETAAAFEGEAEFLNIIAKDTERFTCLGAYSAVKKNRADLYFITEQLPSLAETLDVGDFSEEKIISFGLSMADILAELEDKNIVHGNIRPENIYITPDGRYKLGGFSDYESKIDDLSFLSPETANKKTPDITADIYSVGMIMYYLANNGRLPFESDSVGKADAIEKRSGGAAVPAPENGGEKLKSIIIIACQVSPSSRWKNAVNMKNALLSVQSELPKSEPEDKPDTAAVILTEAADNNSGDFDEYEYDGEPVDEPETPVEEPEAVEEVPEVIEEVPETLEEVPEVIEEVPETLEEAPETVEEVPEAVEKTPEAAEEVPETVEEEPEADSENAESDIEDDFTQVYFGGSPAKTDTSVLGNSDVSFDGGAGTESGESEYDGYGKRDYGNFFEDVSAVSTPVTEGGIASDNSELESDGIEYADDYDESDGPKKRNIIIIVIIILVILCALGFAAYYAITNLLPEQSEGSESALGSVSTAALSESGETKESTKAAETEVSETETAETTAAETTVPKVEVINVAGCGYYYAEKLLEDAGFTVEIGEYKYSSIYDKNYVISQSPEGGSYAEKGSAVTLVVSLGPQPEPSTTAPAQSTTAPTSSASSSAAVTNNSYMFSDSDSSYLSESDLDGLSKSELTIALNEIYARHGRIFSDPTLADYFNSQSWYTPLYTSDEFSDNVTFNSYEQANVQLMVDYMKEKGYR